MARDHQEKNISATGSPFTLESGRYAIECNAASFGTVTLQKLSIDGSTFLPVLGASFAANGVALAALPAGVYEVAIAGATGAYLNITPIL